MNKLYIKLSIVILSAFAIGGCNVDPVIYPDTYVSTVGQTNTGTGTGTGTGTDTGAGTGTGTGTGTGVGTDTGTENTGDGLSVGANNTIQIQLTSGGAIKTYSTNVALTAIQGIISIAAIESQSSLITFGLLDSQVGTYDLFAFQTESLYMETLSIGKIKITASTLNMTTGKGNLQGTFSLDLTDGTNKYPHVIGSFNVTH
ncbi:hypothetical protein ABIB62_003824 [Mucilaginibacter sp. UYP25]|uniref:hypothetical protein n=1 Tax=unclassified Mucilaginibacter TaxID=2617802 RepID=UPI00339A75A5